MRHSAARLCLIGLLAAASFGCIAREGQLAVFLTTTSSITSTLTAQQVNLEVTSVEIWDNEERMFVNLTASSQVYELVGLGGRASLLAMANQLTQGYYSQVRLTFSQSRSSVVTDAGRRQPLRVEPITMTVPAAFQVVEDAESSLLLDIDLAASLALKGNGTWVLRPIIRQSTHR